MHGVLNFFKSHPQMTCNENITYFKTEKNEDNRTSISEPCISQMHGHMTEKPPGNG